MEINLHPDEGKAVVIMYTLAKEHLTHYRQVASIMRDTLPEGDVKLTVLVGRPEEVLDDDSFNWKVLEDKNYPSDGITHATYVYQEQNQVSFISVLIDFENGWAHGMMLTSLVPTSASNWLNSVSLAELITPDSVIPGDLVHRLSPGDSYGELT